MEVLVLIAGLTLLGLGLVSGLYSEIYKNYKIKSRT